LLVVGGSLETCLFNASVVWCALALLSVHLFAVQKAESNKSRAFCETTETVDTDGQVCVVV